ncbi:hypothetical protein BV20DRAFT_224996 [Pilatotrama ljubarskyi]|nr:hypothetical protein BV20DRAFT_224996 [Pilatotrama ljubarskyi]
MMLSREVLFDCASLPPVEYPALERLHCYRGHLSHRLFETARLTHLRVSEVSRRWLSWTCSDTIQTICSASATERAGWCPGLKQVIVQPTPPPFDTGNPFGLGPDEDVYDHYDAFYLLWRDIDHSPVPCYFLPSEQIEITREGEYPMFFQRRIAQQAKEHWLSRIRGGDGCWAVTPEQVRSAQKGECPPEYLIPKDIIEYVLAEH